MTDLKSEFSVYNKKVFAVAFLVALLTLLVYLPALQNGFVNWDDQIYVYENPYIQSIDFKFLKWMFTTFRASHWHPLTWLSHAIDYAIWGLNPMGHHLTSIILHGLNTFLVVLIIIRLINYAKHKTPSPTPPRYESIPTIKGGESQGGSVGGEKLAPLIAGAVTGLLFGIHPIHVESVAWISERKDVLYAFFFLLSILFYLRYTFSLKKQKIYNYSLCLIFFILALMSKPMAVTLPVVLLILDFYPLRRLNLKSVFTSQRKVLIEKIPFIGLSIASSVITIMANQSMGAIVPLGDRPLLDRFLVATKASCFYLFKMVWPTDLAHLYPYPAKISFLTIEYMGALILVVCITGFCIWSWKIHKVFSAVWAYYIVTLLPVLGIIQVGEYAAADRYTYIPSLSPFLLVGLAIASIRKKINIKQHIKLSILILAVLIISLMSIVTVKQINIWRDSITLWSNELKMFPMEKAYLNRGLGYYYLGNYTQAIKDYDKAIELNLFYPQAYVNRGVAYMAAGDFQNAIENYNMAITLNPKDIKAYYDRGILYIAFGNYQQAIKDFQTAARLGDKQAQDYLQSKGIGW